MEVKEKRNKGRRVMGTQGSVPAPKKEIPILKKSVKTGRIIPKDEIEVAPPPPPPKPPHTAKQVEPEILKLPPLSDFPLNMVELPRSIIKLNGEELFSEQLGEVDKAKILTLHKLLRSGWKVHSVQPTDRNSFIFVLVK